MANGYKIVLDLGTKLEFDFCDYEFSKNIDPETARPIDKILGGMIHLGSIDKPDDLIYKWAMKHAAHDGTIQVLRHDDNRGSYIVDEEIAFIEAACTSFKMKYERYGPSHFNTFISLSAKDIKVGKTLSIRKEWQLKAYDLKSSSAPVKLSLPGEQNDTAVNGTLFVGGEEYDIVSFQTEFQQFIDWKGEPEGEVKGGLLTFTINQAADQTLNHWMFDESIAYAGMITFGPKERVANNPVIINFADGRCVFYKKSIRNQLNGIHLTMVISAGLISINGNEHKNNPKYTSA